MNKKFIMAVFCIIAIGGCATTPRLMVPQAKLKAIEAGDHAVLEFHFKKNDIIKDYMPLGMAHLGVYRNVPVKIQGWWCTIFINGTKYYEDAIVDSDFTIQIPVIPGETFVQYQVSSRGTSSEINHMRLRYESGVFDKRADDMEQFKVEVANKETICFELTNVGSPLYRKVKGGTYIFQTPGDYQQVEFQILPVDHK